MALKAKKPSTKEQRLKCFFYGSAGIGKTMAAIQFPCTPYIIDTEGSTNKPQYVKAIDKVGGAVLMTNDFEEMINEVRELLTTKHEYKTLVIDSLTLLYNDGETCRKRLEKDCVDQTLEESIMQKQIRE